MLFLDIESFWRELLLSLCQPIYKLIVYLYELFEVIGTAEILTNDVLTSLYNRIGMLLGVYMMFRIIFSFIQMLINPDNITDKEKGVGKITSKAILTILLLGITPFLFEKAIEIQNYIVGASSGENVIAKLIIPDKIVTSESFGPVLSAYLFESFYRYDDDYLNNTTEEERDSDCNALKRPSDGVNQSPHTYLYSSIVKSKGNVSYAKTCLVDNGKYVATWANKNNQSEKIYKVSFTWNGVFAIVVGLVVCYTLLMYTLMVGARVIQLAFLRIISPMAILTFLSPKKDTMFEKWLKMCTTTYLDLFIRMAIIYFVIFIIDSLMGSDTGIALARDYDHMWLVNIVMIVALLLFAKKAPELIKELLPKSGAASLGFGLKSPKKLFDDMAGSGMLKKVGKSFEKSVGRGAGLIDSLSHGDSLRTALRKNPGFFGSKKNELMKKYAPLAYKSYENRITGGEEIGVMNKNWNAGDKVKNKLESSNEYRSLRARDPNAKWTDLFDGYNAAPYRLVYKNSEFIRSKMNTDKYGDQEKLLSQIGRSVNNDRELNTLLSDLSRNKPGEYRIVQEAFGGTVPTNLKDFHAGHDKVSKTLKGVEEVHESLRKVHAADAKTEDQIKVRKNNPINPTR